MIVKKARRAFERGFKDSKLITKIMMIYVTISVVPILFLGIFLLVQERQTLNEQRTSAVKTALMQAGGTLSSNVRVYDNLSDYIAYNQSVTEVLTGTYLSHYELFEQYSKTIDPILSSPAYFSPDIERLTIYVDKDIPSHGYTVAPLSQIADRKWYRDCRDDLSQSVTWIIDAKNKKVRSLRLMPLMEQNGVTGVMYLEVKYNAFFSDFDKLCQKGQGLVIRDDSGHVVYQRKNGISGEKAATYQEKRKLSTVPLTAYVYGKGTFSIAQNLQVVIVLFIYIVIVAATLLIAAKLFKKYVVSDISSLAENMYEVEKGNRTLMVVSDSKDEIGGLIRGFGTMLSEINRLIKENYENKLSLRKAEMKALQAQINPHFLYNSLSLINWKAIEAGADDISEVTLALSSFYRTSLNRGKNVLSVEKEIENVKSYIKIQSYMHDNSFDTVVDVDEGILQYETLNLLLQPLVENAIDHGIDMKEDGRGFIKIIGRQTADTITLTVEDNGAGMDAETAGRIITFKSKGYGVANVNQRIELFYGKPYGLKVESEPGRGTRCTVTIPKRKIG